MMMMMMKISTVEVGLMGFVGFVELILWELIFVFVREMQMGGAEFLERESEERERGGVRSKNEAQ